ncbi:hypothetical protein NX029_26150 [Cytobacillus firmus]|nr:hypothetical protein [Cytobacillus firmus]
MKKKRSFKTHAAMDLGEGRKLEIMFAPNLDRVTIRAVRDGVALKPYSKSEVFADEQGAFLILVNPAEEEWSYTKLYLDNFKRVRGV